MFCSTCTCTCDFDITVVSLPLSLLPLPLPLSLLKERLGTSVRSALNEQLNKIQWKHTMELELIDDVRYVCTHTNLQDVQVLICTCTCTFVSTSACIPDTSVTYMYTV